MLYQMAAFLTNKLNREHIQSQDDFEVYVYGWQMILSTGAGLGGVLILSLFFRQFWGSLLFMLVFLGLRKYAGGFHANSYLGCFATMMAVYGCCLAAAILLPDGYRGPAAATLSLFSAALVFLLAPRDHPNRRVQGEERLRFKVRSRWTALLMTALTVTLSVFAPWARFYALWAGLGMMAGGLLLLVRNKAYHKSGS